MAESMNLKDLDLSLEESRDVIEFLARRRNVSNYEHMKSYYLPSKKPHIYLKNRKSWVNAKILKF